MKRSAWPSSVILSAAIVITELNTSYLHSNTLAPSKGRHLGAWHSGGASEGWRGVQAGPGGHHPGPAEGSGAQQEGVPGSRQQCQVHAGHCTYLAHTHTLLISSRSLTLGLMTACTLYLKGDCALVTA